MGKRAPANTAGGRGRPPGIAVGPPGIRERVRQATRAVAARVAGRRRG